MVSSEVYSGFNSVDSGQAAHGACKLANLVYLLTSLNLESYG